MDIISNFLYYTTFFGKCTDNNKLFTKKYCLKIFSKQYSKISEKNCEFSDFAIKVLQILLLCDKIRKRYYITKKDIISQKSDRHPLIFMI